MIKIFYLDWNYDLLGKYQMIMTIIFYAKTIIELSLFINIAKPKEKESSRMNKPIHVW